MIGTITATRWQRDWAGATGRPLTTETAAAWADTLREAGNPAEGAGSPIMHRPKWNGPLPTTTQVLNLRIRYVCRALFGATLLSLPAALRLAPRAYTAADVAPCWRDVERCLQGDLDADHMVSRLMALLGQYEAIKGAPHAAAAQVDYWQRVWIL